ncbi:pyruvate carboxyltransferase [Salipiger aestuarii]|uniref:hydroxymethylglutaryl-CoA lyase n=1 Tax=Salipiger aestuarii TaxID=568098 RepID=UPI00123B6850|nr:hydroxymethylglutaryl-CoA lyase [Salipiger aestuarii]KAA8605753.1 pyruvate carboxyltransferase [Salipiger aestuarii]KAA8612164.1 pyruvate carboxyltransferase [Salipiger aestuarii]
MTARPVTIVEVGPRDGFQGIVPFIPTERKIQFIERLAATGLERFEITSCVSDKAVPQLADAKDVIAASQGVPGVHGQVLIPTASRARQALAFGARSLAYVLSVSESHNRNNVRRTPEDSVSDYAAMIADLPPGISLRLNIATAFDCPFEGRIGTEQVLTLLDQLIPLAPTAEIALCDTTGKAVPDQVGEVFDAVISRFPEVGSWAVHTHDTYGLGLANVHAAWEAGVRVVDAAFAGLGGCPFAPGASGNVATEDVVWMFERRGIQTNVDLSALIEIAKDGACIPGASAGGRVRKALAGCA